MRPLLLLVGAVTAACGRVAFDPVATDGDARGDDDAALPAFCSTGAATACPPGAMFCDDFETSSGTTFPRWAVRTVENWSTAAAPNPGTDLTATGSPCRGTRSAHGRTVGGAQSAYVLGDIGVRPNPLYMRVWFRIASTSPVNELEMMGLYSTTSQSILHIGVDRGTQELTVSTTRFVSAAEAAYPVAPIAADRWTCMEARFQLATTATGAVRISIDGATAVDVQDVVTEGATLFDRAVLSVQSLDTETGTYDVDLDEVVLSASPIGCT